MMNSCKTIEAVKSNISCKNLLAKNLTLFGFLLGVSLAYNLLRLPSSVFVEARSQKKEFDLLTVDLSPLY